MSQVIKRWFRKYFSDPQAVILAVLLLLGFTVVIFMGKMLAPLLISVVVAYLLEGLVGLLTKVKVRRGYAVTVVFLLFITFVLFLILGLLPMLSKQVTQLVQEMPNMITRGQHALMLLPEKYPHFISPSQVEDIMKGIRSAVGVLGQNVVSWSLASITGIIIVGVYVVLVPVLVFFFLKDKDLLINWVTSFLPKEREVAIQVWDEMSQQIGNYVRGKFVEILIVWIATFIVFALMGLNFAMLLSALVGLSVIIPYIGAITVVIPVVLIAYFQWGWGSDFAYLVIAYTVIQTLDGNILVPLLFSEAVNLHPVAIIASVLVFGGIWGFWGVFFAIPLATLVKAVVHAWPRAADEPTA
ncbi:MAG TPA: AI-2E family transporter [Gammaproteobacteria bacterium]|nr:AI-2E family transporter [Gammaproteobacteria bacterium]